MADINVTYSITELGHGAVKLDIKSTGIDMPGKVFAIEVLPKSRDRYNINYRFSHICSISEIIEFPVEETEDMCYFRTDEIALIFDTIILALHTRDAIDKDIKLLVQIYNAMDEDIGPDPEPEPDPGPDKISEIYYKEL